MSEIDPLRIILEKLENYPALKYEKDDHSITVLPDDETGFDVSFRDEAPGYVVCFRGWHEHFENSEIQSALECFAFGLSGKCRLKVYSRGGRDYEWELEVSENGRWQSYSTTGLLFFCFWKKKTIRYLQNKIVSPEMIFNVP